MKKLLIALLLLSFSCGYMEWGKGQKSTFIFQAVIDFFYNLKNEPKALAHPLILLPLIGMSLLVYTLFQKYPSSILVVSGLACLSVLILLLLGIGLFSLNLKIVISVIPFFVVSVLLLKSQKGISQE